MDLNMTMPNSSDPVEPKLGAEAMSPSPWNKPKLARLPLSDTESGPMPLGFEVEGLYSIS